MKKVHFKMNETEREDYQEDWQQEQLQKGQQKITDMEQEIKKLKKLLDVKNYEQVYKENEMMKKELKSMQILLDENQELREELERLRQMSYNDRVKESGAENQILRRRNGELLIKNSELMDEIERLKKEAPLSAPKIQQPVFVRP